VEDPGYSILLGYGFRSGKRLPRRRSDEQPVEEPASTKASGQA
jgi:hypothetical protein